MKRQSKVKLAGLDPETSSEVIEAIYAIGVAAMLPNAAQKASEKNESCSDIDVIPKGKVRNLVRDISTLPSRIISTINEESKNDEDDSSLNSSESDLSNSDSSESDASDSDGSDSNASDSDDSDSDDSDSDDSTDYEEFVEYAKAKIKENNRSFDPASYRTFESLVAQAVRKLFKDDDDDQDSLASASSFSGYDHESDKRSLEENSLISESSYNRLRGQIATKKNVVVEKAVQEDVAEVDENYQLEENSMMSETPYDQWVKTLNTPETAGGNEKRTNDCSQPAIAEETSENAHESDESTVIAGAPNLITKSGKNDSTGRPKGYEVTFDENSLVSRTPYQPQAARTIGRRGANRARRPRRKPEVDNSALDVDVDAWCNVEHAIDDIAFSLAKQNHRGGRLSNLLEDHDSEVILAGFKKQLPALYKAVVLKMDEFRDCAIDSPKAYDKSKAGQYEATVFGASHGQKRSQVLEKPIRIYSGTPDKIYEADKSQDENDLNEIERALKIKVPPNASNPLSRTKRKEILKSKMKRKKLSRSQYRYETSKVALKGHSTTPMRSDTKQFASGKENSNDMRPSSIGHRLASPSLESPIRACQIFDSDRYVSQGTAQPPHFTQKFNNAERDGFPLRLKVKESLNATNKAYSPDVQVDPDPFEVRDSFNDSFDEIVKRTTPGKKMSEGEEPLFIVRKFSPTSIVDFFDERDTTKRQKETAELAFVDDGENDPLFVDEDEQLTSTSFQEAGPSAVFADSNFNFPDRFDV